MNTLINNSDFIFTFESGIISGYSKSIINNTYSSGGGGTLINGNGYIAPPTIYTESIPQVDFFLKKNNGKENEISLSGYNLNLRDGQKISLIWGNKKNATIKYLISVYNHNTDKNNFITNESTVVQLGLASTEIKIPFLVHLLFFFIAFPFWCLFIVINYFRNKKNKKSILKTIKEINNTIKNISQEQLLSS